MRSSDGAVKLCSRRDRTSLSGSCALLSLDNIQQLQNGTKPLINGLNKATLPDTRCVIRCLEVGSLGWRYQANSLLERLGDLSPINT
jgi:X-X-X-Leu-X-X-Gly heptad repeat protein